MSGVSFCEDGVFCGADPLMMMSLPKKAAGCVLLVAWLALLTAMGVSLWLSALYVLYRDVQYIIPFLVQIWMYVSPVMYPTSKIPKGWPSVVFSLNPMTGVVGGFRWALFGEQAPNSLFWVSAFMVLVLFVSGLYYFRRMERVFADLV